MNVIVVLDGLGGALEMNALPKEQIKEFVLSDASETIIPEDGLA